MGFQTISDPNLGLHHGKKAVFISKIGKLLSPLDWSDGDFYFGAFKTKKRKRPFFWLNSEESIYNLKFNSNFALSPKVVIPNVKQFSNCSA